MLGTIAKGAFGKVYRVSLRDQPHQLFAMKVCVRTFYNVVT